MSFTHWMSELRTHQPLQHTAASPMSVASSWADTDCESDSDSEHGNYVFFGHKQTRKSAAMERVYQRTDPISIPQATHDVRSRSPALYDETPVEHYSGDYSRDSMGAIEIDEDDLMLFGNLAYLRSQHGATATSAQVQRSAVMSCESAPSDEDEQIFELEM